MTADAGEAVPTEVLIIDDHRMLAEALAIVLDSEDDLHVVGVAASLAEGLAVVRSRPVDVVLLDYRLPDASGLDGVSMIREISPSAAVIMITAVEDEGLLLAAVEAGCAGFVAKSADLRQIHVAVKHAAAGEAAIQPKLLASLLGRLARRRTEQPYDLTPREREVLVLISHGHSNAEIAERLVLSVNTIRNHVQSLLGKLGAHSKLEAAAIGVREGLIDPHSRLSTDARPR